MDRDSQSINQARLHHNRSVQPATPTPASNRRESTITYPLHKLHNQTSAGKLPPLSVPRPLPNAKHKIACCGVGTQPTYTDSYPSLQPGTELHEPQLSSPLHARTDKHISICLRYATHCKIASIFAALPGRCGIVRGGCPASLHSPGTTSSQEHESCPYHGFTFHWPQLN
jgi:hypothetical protein